MGENTIGDVATGDIRRAVWLLSPALPVFGIVSLIVFAATGAHAALWAQTVLVYIGIPLGDWWWGRDARNADDAAMEALLADRWYRRVVFAYVPLQYAVTVLGCWLLVSRDVSGWDVAGLLLTVGVLNGGGINTAHELGHKREALERWLSKVALAPVAYGHFFVEHNRGHHKHVATPCDPASARLGETFWAFLPRTVAGGVRSAWALERERLTRRGLSVWDWRNDVSQAWAMTVVLFAALTLWLGWVVLPFLIAQAVYGASLLEAVNYIEHYGLLRAERAPGRYEPCMPEHSWNSDFLVSNLVLYHLQRHSDHHANPGRPYQVLRHMEGAPELPFGYALMTLMAYAPPLFFRVMDPIVAAHYGHDLALAHVHPPARARLAARFASA